MLERCLQKDSRQRLRDAGDARIEIDDAGADEAAVPPAPRRVTPVAFVLALLVVALFATASWWIFRGIREETRVPLHLSFALPYPTASILNINAGHRLAISPDGKKIVYVVRRGEKSLLFLRMLAEPEGKLIDGPEDVRVPFFSPDSEWIAYGQGQELQKVAVSGGSPATICQLSSTAFYGGDWGADNTIVFVPDFNGGLWSVSASGGTPKPMSKTDVEKDRVSYGDPQVLPAGKGVMFTLTSGHAAVQSDLDIAVIGPGSSEPRILIHGGSNARYVGTKGCARATVPGQLIKIIAYSTDKELLGKKTRSFQVQMPVDAVLIVRVRVLKIIGQAGHSGKFKACGCIEIRITETIVERRMSVPQIDNAVRVIGADRNATPSIDHEIVHPLIRFP
jgi:serine/threonine-protein kinase